MIVPCHSAFGMLVVFKVSDRAGLLLIAFIMIMIIFKYQSQTWRSLILERERGGTVAVFEMSTEECKCVVACQ